MEVLPWRAEERAFRREVTVVARVVLPCKFSGKKLTEGKRMERETRPEPGIPDMAIRRRWVGGVDWNLAGQEG